MATLPLASVAESPRILVRESVAFWFLALPSLRRWPLRNRFRTPQHARMLSADALRRLADFGHDRFPGLTAVRTLMVAAALNGCSHLTGSTEYRTAPQAEHQISTGVISVRFRFG